VSAVHAWTQLSANNATGVSDRLFLRGHTAVLYQRNLVFFGGRNLRLVPHKDANVMLGQCTSKGCGCVDGYTSFNCSLSKLCVCARVCVCFVCVCVFVCLCVCVTKKCVCKAHRI